ncbi:MAG: tetratricopeptide repeat protein, partial [Polyangiaceae bacterium]|nr:tetratricopeptide repeat protein [Polyangiaceae bacterium]
DSHLNRDSQPHRDSEASTASLISYEMLTVATSSHYRPPAGLPSYDIDNTNRSSPLQARQSTTSHGIVGSIPAPSDRFSTSDSAFPSPYTHANSHFVADELANPNGLGPNGLGDPYRAVQQFPNFPKPGQPTHLGSQRHLGSQTLADAAQQRFADIGPISTNTISIVPEPPRPYQSYLDGYPSDSIDADSVQSDGTSGGISGDQSGAFRGGDSLEDALEEAEFFASRGLFDDAMAVLQEQNHRFPNHPLVVERMREIANISANATANAAASATARDMVERASMLPRNLPSVLPTVLPSVLPSIAPPYDDSDLADFVATPRPAPVSPSLTRNPVSSSAAESLASPATYKDRVRTQISESDSQTHYDLGMAYKDMGLLTDAITEYSTAARDPKRECVCWSMIGFVRMELGDLDGAIEAFTFGLNAEHKTAEQELALYFELGVTYQTQNKNQQALYFFSKVQRRDPGFRDIAGRIQGLAPASSASARSPRFDPASSRRAPADPAKLTNPSAPDDDFDREFDDLFVGSGLSH